LTSGDFSGILRVWGCPGFARDRRPDEQAEVVGILVNPSCKKTIANVFAKAKNMIASAFSVPTFSMVVA